MVSIAKELINEFTVIEFENDADFLTFLIYRLPILPMRYLNFRLMFLLTSKK